MKQTFFSIVIPTRGRPKFLRDALVSALRQDFDDFEVVASDNYNDRQTQALLAEFKEERRLRCVRTDRLLNMPEHWDFATQHARGQYVLILTDRSVLKQGALKAIHDAISSSETSVDVCSWRWSLYNDAAGNEYGDGYMFKDKKTITFSSRRLADEFARGIGGYVYCLPRGLNSCYKSTLMQHIRDEFGSPFKPIAPDYYSAFVIMGVAQDVLHIDKSLMISQGNSDSNGGRMMSGADTGYLKSLGGYDLYTHVPLKSPLVKNLIYEDFLVAREAIGGNLKDVVLNWPAYFGDCYRELLIKKDAGILSSDEMAELFAEWARALSTFDLPTQKAAEEKAEILFKSFNPQTAMKIDQKKTITGSCLIRVQSWINKKIRAPQARESTSKGVRLGGERKRAVLEIAGF